MALYDFLFAAPYESRKVARLEKGELTISTCSVNDVEGFNYETGIKHPRYKDNRWVIVEQYETKERAQKGHNKWVKKMTLKLPHQLKDVSTCCVAVLANAFGDKDGTYQKEERKE